jgi:hypothetical protein
MANSRLFWIIVIIAAAAAIVVLVHSRPDNHSNYIRANDSLEFAYKNKNDSLNALIKRNKEHADSIIDSIKMSPPRIVKKIVLKTIYKAGPDTSDDVDSVQTDSVCYTAKQNTDIAIKLVSCDEMAVRDSLELQKCKNEVKLVVDTSNNVIKDKDEQIKHANKSAFKVKLVAATSIVFAIAAMVASW